MIFRKTTIFFQNSLLRGATEKLVFFEPMDLHKAAVSQDSLQLTTGIQKIRQGLGQVQFLGNDMGAEQGRKKTAGRFPVFGFQREI